LLKKTIVYENPFTQQMVSEEHYFHISKADLIEMQMENLNEPEVINPQTGAKLEGYPAMLQRIVNDKDGKEILVVVKDMVRRAYGKKSGDRFLRSPEIWEEFISSEAWSQLYFELCTDAGAQADFMNGIFPRDMLEEANKLAAAQAQTNGDVSTPEQDVPADVSTPRVLTNQEVAEMDSDELKSGLATGRYKLS
jgi:hypothetical protein